jgi:RNA polymerase sigma-70 factor (ECF subfamily)
MSETVDPQQLLADAAWLHRLARSLAGSDADADDLVQESWIAAWRKRPDSDRSLRPWLGKVVRDVAAMKRRGDRRREVREQAADLQPGTPPDVLLEQMRLHRMIVDLVLELAEPYRATVLARFVEGRSAASIARSLGIPESTVRGRLHEAIERLRAGLDTKTGERKAWAPAVIAFAQNGVIVAKSSKSIVMIVLLALALVAVVVVPRLRGSADESTTPPDPTRSGGSAIAIAGTPRDADLPAWFGVKGAAPRRIAGRVTFEDKPVAGATVSLHSQLVAAGVRPLEHRTTGADGNFDFGLRAVAPYQVTAEAADRVPAVAFVQPEPAFKSDQLELRLQGCRASIAGTIFDASGGFIAKARVLRDGVAGVIADDRGAYKLCATRGRSEIEFSAEGYASVVLGLDIDGEQRQDIVLVPEGSITVRVVREEDNTPVAQAAVFANPQEWGRDRPQNATALTDSEGRARLGKLVPGPYRVFGFAEGMQASAPAAATAEVGASPEVVLRMGGTARITGKVVMNGKPVGDANVVAIRTSPATRSQNGYTGTDGTFALERVAIGELRFAAHPYEVKSPATLKIDAARTYDNVVIEVEALGSIRGRVTRNGKPLENIDVCCVPTPTMPARQLTDVQGRYVFTGVPEGRYEIGGGADDIGAFAFGKKLELARGEHAVVDVELDQAGAISGSVVDKTGAPVPGVFVRWLHETTGDVGRCTSDVKGHYRCAAMTGGGKYRAAVFPAGSRQTPYQPADGKPHPVIELKDAASAIDNVVLAIDYKRLSISGRVVDGAGAAIADVEVKALAVAENHPPQFLPWAKLPSTFTSVDGTFSISELPPGTYALQARSSDGGEGTVTNIVAGATTATIKIVRPGGIAGTLVGFTTPPVIYARPLDGQYRLIPAVVDGTSAFRITGVRPGRYLVGAQTTAEGDAQVAEVRAGVTAQLAMTAKGRGVIEGSVLDFRTRAPIANARCHAVMTVDGEQIITNWDVASVPRSDAEGRVVIDPAPAGSVSAFCAIPRQRWSNPSAVATLAPGGRVTVQLLSVELTVENVGTSGIEFDGRVVQPRIAALAAKSPARAAGLVIGDVVTAVNGTRVDGLNGIGVMFLIESIPVGSELAITVARGKTATFTMPPHAD